MLQYQHTSNMLNNIVNGAFGALFLVASNYVGETLGCGVQEKLQNMRYKHILVFMFILTSMISSHAETDAHPLDAYKRTIFVYVTYIMMARMHFKTMCALILIMLASQEFKRFHKYNTNNDKLLLYSRRADSMAIIVCVLGFLTYLRTKHLEHNDWDTLKFFFGTAKCAKNN